MAGILLPATELPAAGCHVCAAAAQPRGDPDGQCSISSPSTMTPSREERVEQVMPVRDSLLEAVPIVHGSRVGFAPISDTRMLVYVAYCQRDSSYYFSLRLDREGHREIDHERSSAIHAEIDFALLATDGPAVKSTWSNIRIRASVSVSPRANVDFL